MTDTLTGLGNRRRMEEELASTHGRARRIRRSYGIALFDIDHFKLYNDHYGHLAGDDALRRVARCLDDTVRAGESIYRYGGEEFLLLLPDCGLADAGSAAERIRQSVIAAAIPHEARPTKPATVTLSGGLTCWTPGSDLSLAELLHQADQALFQAKAAGRNRIHMHLFPTTQPQREHASTVR
jgi:diguanylate cyclase (GGDEF)-like protein